MIAVTLTLLAFGVFDLVRWSPENTTTRRSLAAFVTAVAATAGIAATTGSEPGTVALVAVLAVLVLSAWFVLDEDDDQRTRDPARPRASSRALAVPILALLTAFAISGSVPAGSGVLGDWYRKLPFAFAESVPLDQFLIGMSAAVFLLATANRIVRLVLEAAGTPVSSGETTLPGGRLLGPMERIFVAAMVLAGDPTSAAIVIAAKGLLRLPEIRSSADHLEGRPDHVTEYFLIGTFFSLLLAGGAAALILASY